MFNKKEIVLTTLPRDHQLEKEIKLSTEKTGVLLHEINSNEIEEILHKTSEINPTTIITPTRILNLIYQKYSKQKRVFGITDKLKRLGFKPIQFPIRRKIFGNQLKKLIPVGDPLPNDTKTFFSKYQIINRYEETHWNIERFGCLITVKDYAAFRHPTTNQIHIAVVPCDQLLSKNYPQNILRQQIEFEFNKKFNQSHISEKIEQIHIVAEIPRDSLLQVKRKELIENIINKKKTTKTSSLLKNDSIMTKIQNILPMATPETSFKYDLDIDSLTYIELLVELETTFQIKIQDEEFQNLNDISDLIQLIKKKEKQSEKKDYLKDLLDRAYRLVPEVKQDFPQKRPILDKTLKPLFNNILKSFIKIYYNIQVTGLNHLPRKSPYIICSNHLSNLDYFALVAASGLNYTDFYALTAAEHLFDDLWLHRWGRYALQLIPFSRSLNINMLLKNFAKTTQIINEKKSMIIFPEGTRSLDGNLLEFKPFIGMVADELSVDIVPAYIENTLQLYPRGKVIPKPGRISVSFGKTIDIASLKSTFKDFSPFLRYKEITKTIQNEVQKLIHSG